MEHGVVAGLHSAELGGVTPFVPADLIRFPDTTVPVSGPHL